MGMLLEQLLSMGEVQEADGDCKREITGLSYDSRKTQSGDVFFAVSGQSLDGHDFMDEACKRGAAAIVVERERVRPASATVVRVNSVRRTMGLWSSHFHGEPSGRMTVVGVTGTNGKTTVSYLVESILQAAGLNVGVIGTVSYRYCGREIPSHHTTPESPDLQALLAHMAGAGVNAIAMEVSSHALVQERVRGVNFDVAVFTNLSRDHLDYHRNMDEYFLAKRRLFADHLKNSAKAKKAAVIYGDDERGRELAVELHDDRLDMWTYGQSPRWDTHPIDIESDVTGLRGTLRLRGDSLSFSSRLIGAANLQNIMAGASVGWALGLPPGAVSKGIEQMESVPGRLEKVPNELGVSVLVDYAHTPDALEKVLRAVRPLTRGRLLTVFGCGGDRDRGKRPLMGELAARLSDVLVLTSDNPRTEDPLRILAEIEAGVQRSGLKQFRVSGFGFRVSETGPGNVPPSADRGYCIEEDRRKAIRMALSLARPGDLVLIAGKGHEDYQILGAKRVPFDDREVAGEEANRLVEARGRAQSA